MAEIRELDQKTVERIAAGEVVERPASVVKELVENSLDAGAGRIEVAVDAGGTERVRVADDGRGMTEREVRSAVEEHTTSKITDIGDLEGGVGTLGFRGEALHAIGAVSRLAITTRPNADRHPQGGGRGTELTVEGGEVTAVEPAGAPDGTTVEVTDLFYNVPARRKYLKQESTEFAHVNTVTSGYALANPDVAISLTQDDRETFATPGRGDRREAIMAVYGREVAEAMVAVDGADLPEGPLDGVSGLVSHPETNRASRDYLSTFVNGRYITVTGVREAAVEAYGTQLAPDRYPFAVLDLSLDPAAVDVNVHPRKLEVRFANEAAVREQIAAVVEETLLDAGLVRSGAPRGQSAPEQTEIRPETPDDGDREEATAGSGSAGRAATGTHDTGPRTGSGGAASASDAPYGVGSDTSSRDETPDSGASGSAASGSAQASRTHPERKFTPSGEQERLGEAPDPEAEEFESLPAMRVLGQLHDTYVVAETPEGLVLVDQHAADERVNYERLRESFDGDVGTQVLAEPVEVSLTAGEADLFEAHADALARLGFRAERVGDRAVEVRTVPTLVAETADPELLRDVLAEFVASEGEADRTVEAAAEDLLADLACYPSITGNTSLTEGSVVDLLSALDGCENPYACPHGRPVVIELDREELESRFERDYPGHG